METCIKCNKEENNPFSHLCVDHINELKTKGMHDAALIYAKNRGEHPYFINDGDSFGEVEDSPRFLEYIVMDGYGKTEEEFIENVSIGEIDQDGEEHACHSFKECSDDIQNDLLDQAVGNCECGLIVREVKDLECQLCRRKLK